MEIPTMHRLEVKRGKFFLRIGVPFLFFGFALKLVCDMVFNPVIQYSLASMSWLDFLTSTLLPCCIMSVVALIFIATNHTDECEQYYRYIIPIVSVFILLSCIRGIGSLSDIFASTSYLCLEFMLWMELCVISHRYRISPILVVGFGRGALVVGMLGMSILAFLPIDMEQLINNGLIYLFIIVMLVVGYSLLPREKDIKSMVILAQEPERESAQNQGGRAAVVGLKSPAENNERFNARCARIANTFLLSPREVDVLFLLAKGRNAAYIAKHLYISEGTVNTHMWRIYKKLNVHSQQELMDMIDEPQGAAAQQKHA